MYRPHITRKEAHRLVFIVVCLATGVEVICCYGFISQKQMLEVLSLVAMWAKDHIRKVVRSFIDSSLEE